METRVRELMRERGLRASDVAARVGQPVNVVSNELSRGLTSVPSVAKYARALQVPVWEMLCAPVVSAKGKELTAWSEPTDDKGAPTRIGAIMRERGLTQLQLAERMSAIRQNVNKWVTSTKLNLSTLQAFATALEIDAEHLYLLFVSQEEYDAEMVRRAQPTPATFDPHDPSPIQTVTEAINNAPSSARVESAEQQLTINNATLAIAHADLECEELLHSQMKVNGMGTEPDLFTQIEEVEQVEAEWAKVLTDGVYTYGGKRIVLRGGEIVIR